MADVRTEFHHGGRLTTARGARFEENPVCHFAGAAETLRIRKSIIAPESADGLTLVLHKRERWVRADRVAKFLEFPINAVLSQDRPESQWIKEDVDIF